MMQKIADPFFFFVIVILGSLALSVVLGTIDACRSKGPEPTLSIRVGARWTAALFRLNPLYSKDIDRAFEEAATIGKYSFWSKVFDSIGGCWVVTGTVLGMVYAALVVLFT
ncbi:MAG TPA: hypothetical protein VFJ01_06890 [Oleiagrimonas sp.]|nr:hypothetical protein [Oleiagrimonas sp.]